LNNKNNDALHYVIFSIFLTFHSLRSKYQPQHFTLKHLHLCSYQSVREILTWSHSYGDY